MSKEVLSLPQEKPDYISEEVWGRLLTKDPDFSARFLREMQDDVAERDASSLRSRIFNDLQEGFSFQGIIRVHGGLEELERRVGSGALEVFHEMQDSKEIIVITG